MNKRLFYLGTGFLLGYAALTLPQANGSIALAQSTQRSFTCNTDGYSAQIRWRGSQPLLTFGAKSEDPNIRNTPVEELSRRGIVTYTTQQGESKTTVFEYSDGTCAVAVSNASGEVTVNELGQTEYQGEVAASPPRLPASSSPTPSSPAPSSPASGAPASGSSNETLTAFQTQRNAVRIFTRNGETLINIYDKEKRVTWINGVPVDVEQTPEGTHYTAAQGESKIEVFLNLNGDRILSVNGNAEEGY